MLVRIEVSTAILFGAGSVSKIGEEAAKLGHKAMVVTYPDIRRIGLLDKVLKALKEKKVDAVVFERVEPNPRVSTVNEGAAIARKEKIDLVIGLGGGSAMDSAKAIALGSSGIVSIWNYMDNPAEAKGVIPPIIQIPTMAGTGSELNTSAVLTQWETHIKRPLGGIPGLQAKVAIIDPEITLSVPFHQTKAGSFDIFCHVVEPYLTDDAPRPLTDGIRETCMKMVVQYLPRVIAHLDDIEARTELSWASTIAMSKLSRLGSGGGTLTCHDLEHALSGYYDITHGDGLAALLPAWMKSFDKVREDRFKSLGKNVFGKNDGIKATEEFLDSIGMRLRLGQLGCKLEDAQAIAELTIISSPMLKTHPTLLDTNAIAKIYRDSF